MKALTLQQPWASLVMMGAKKFETRSWKTEFRGPLLIHASATRQLKSQVEQFNSNPLFQDFIPDINSLPYGAVIGLSEFVGIYRTEDVTDPATMIHIMFNKHEEAFGNFTKGRFAWALDELQIFETPIPYKGSRRLWDFPEELLPSNLENRSI